MKFKDRVALITGGANGIGYAVAENLAYEGCNIALVDIHEEGLTEAQNDLKKYPVETITVACDVSNKNEVMNMVETVKDNFNRIDFLINVAGGTSALSREEGRSKLTPIYSIETLDEQDWNKVIDVNLKGVFLVTQQVVPIMKKQRFGRIVNVSSLAARQGSSMSNGAYAAAKAGVIGLTKQLAKELGPYQITTNAVAPGYTASERFLQNWNGRLVEEQRKKIESQIPLGYVSSVKEQASVIAFLCSNDAKYVNGVTVDVNGGIYLV